MVQIHFRPSPPPAPQPSPSYQYKPQRPLMPKWDGTPTTTPLFLAQIATYKAEALYARVHDWNCTTLASRQISAAISSDMLALFPSSISSMFLNEARFVSDRIAMIYSLLTNLNPSSSENLLLAISDLTGLKMRLGKSSIDYMSRVQEISQHMQGITMERIIPLFAISSLDHDGYPGSKIRYLEGYVALVNSDLLQLSGLLSIKETQQRALGIPSAPPSTTVANHVSNTPTQPPPEGCSAPHPPHPPT